MSTFSGTTPRLPLPQSVPKQQAIYPFPHKWSWIATDEASPTAAPFDHDTHGSDEEGISQRQSLLRGDGIVAWPPPATDEPLGYSDFHGVTQEVELDVGQLSPPRLPVLTSDSSASLPGSGATPMQRPKTIIAIPNGSPSSSSSTTTATMLGTLRPAVRGRGRPAKVTKQTPRSIEKRYRCKLDQHIAELRRIVPTLRDRDEGQEHGDADDETAQSTARTSVSASRASTAVGLTWTAKRNKATIFAKTIEYIQYLEAQQYQQQDGLISRLYGLERENKAMRTAVRAFSKWFNGMKNNPDQVAEGARSGSADAGAAILGRSQQQQQQQD